MKEKCSTREAAKELGRSLMTIQRHIAAGTIEAPRLLRIGSVTARLWTARDIEKARKVLVGTRPGRKKKT
jgi:excisionase family DNA binding protein